jgi:hypothetical protein
VILVLRFGAKLGDLHFERGACLVEVALGGEIGALRPVLYRGDNGLGLQLGEAGLTQPLRDF